MPKEGPVLAISEDSRYTQATSLVGLCTYSIDGKDVVITTEIKTGKAICPVTGGIISLTQGVCQATKETCGFHS